MNTLGETLKRERLRQGLEIKDVEESISIRGLYLNAIEEGNYKVVPGEVYLKGFIRNYAIHLGLDPQDMLEIYRQDKEALAPEDKLPEEKNLPVAKNRQQGAKVRKYQRRREEKREERKKSGFSIGRWQVLLLFAAGAIVWGVMNFSSLSIAPSPAEPSGQSESAVSPAPGTNVANSATQPQNTAQTPPTEAAQTAGKNVTVAAKFTDKCWTQVNVDGKLEYEGTPNTGESLVFSGDQRIFIRLGNAGVVELTHNGKNLGIVGKVGEVVIKTFTKDSETSVTSQ